MTVEDRRELLYLILTSNPNWWFSQEELCLQIKDYILLERKDNDRCPNILKDIKAINADPKYEKILICKDYKFTVADKETLRTYLRERYNRLKRQKEMIEDLKSKIKRHGHGDILNEDEFFESFISMV